MKIIFEYLQNAFYILEGYVKWAYDKITGLESKRGIARMKICKECEHNRRGICSICGCILNAKVRVNFPLDENGKSIDGCPLKKW